MADGEVRIDITADDSDAREALEGVEDAAHDAADGMDDLGDSADNAGNDLDALDVAAGNLIEKGISALTGALKNAVTNLIALAEETREYRDDMAKLETAFTDAGFSTEAASAIYEDFYAILGESDRSVEAVNHLAELTNSEEELAKWADIAAGVTAKFGDSLPIEGLTEAANETAKVGSVTGPLADALNWAGISEDEFNERLAECADEQERAALITETLSTEYADAAAQYNELTASTQEARRATSAMEQVQADLGAAIEPVTTAWTNLKAQALEAIVPVIEKVSEGFQALSAWLEENPGKAEALKAVLLGVAAALGVLATALGISALIQTVTKAFAALNTAMLANPVVWIVAAIAALVAAFIYLWNNCEGFREFWENLWDSIVEWLRGAVDNVVAFFTETIPAAIETVKEWFAGLVETLVEFATVKVPEFIGEVIEWFQQLPEKIAYVIGYIIGSIAKFALSLWEFLTVTVPEFITGVIEWFAQLPGKIWEWLKQAVEKVVDWGKETVKTCKEKMQEFINTAVTFISTLPEKVWEWLNQTINKVISFGSSVISKGKEAASGLFTAIVDGVKALPEKIMEIGENIVSGLWNGISSGWTWLTGKVKNLASSLVSGVKDALGIASPSKEFAWVGEMSADGYGVGYEDEMDTVEKDMKSRLASMVTRVKATVSAENARVGQSVGTPDTGLGDIARAIGTQTAGINSLASEYRRGSYSTKPVILQLDGRELGRAVVDVGNAETTRIGTQLAVGVT